MGNVVCIEGAELGVKKDGLLLGLREGLKVGTVLLIIVNEGKEVGNADGSTVGIDELEDSCNKIAPFINEQCQLSINQNIKYHKIEL